MPKKKKPAKKSVKVVKVRKPAAKPVSKPKVKAPAKAAVASPVAIFRDAILHHLKSTFARDRVTATRNDWWMATCMAARDQMLERYIDTQSQHASKNVRRVYYLSLEYLMGRVLTNNLVNLQLREVAAQALSELGSRRAARSKSPTTGWRTIIRG
ncbi:MAG: hypothetical protein RL515_1186 [Verrucomicrobiota bacterium]